MKMSKAEAGKLGGLKSIAFNVAKKQERILAYKKNPTHCKNCNKEMDYEKRNNVFCDSSCAATYNNIGKSRSKKPIIECLTCKKPFRYSHHSKNMYCSNACQQVNSRNQRIEKWLATGAFDAINVPGWAKNYIRTQRGDKCQVCSTEYWNGVKLPLECDHVDGNASNNHIDNLRLICPNCHSLTSSFKGKNRGNGRTHRYKK